MAETTTLEPETSTTEPDAPSDDGQILASTEAESLPAAEPESTSTEPVTPEPPRARTIAEIRAAIDDPAGVATGAELRQLRAYEQSARDTQSRIEAQRAEYTTAVTAAQSLALTAVEAELSAAAARDREPDLDLIRSKMETVFATLAPKAERAALAQVDAGVDQTLLAYVDGDVGQFREITQGKNFYDKVNLMATLAYQMGQRDGPGEDMVVETKAEREAAIQAAVREAQSKTPARGASVGGAQTPAAPARYTTQEGARELHAAGSISTAEMRRIQNSPAWRTLPRS